MKHNIIPYPIVLFLDDWRNLLIGVDYVTQLPFWEWAWLVLRKVLDYRRDVRNHVVIGSSLEALKLSNGSFTIS